MSSQSYSSSSSQEQNMCQAPPAMSGGQSYTPAKNYGSNEKNASSIPAADPGKDGKVQEAAKNMGDVKSLDGGFYSAAGGLADALCPNEGDKGKLQLNVNVPVEQTGTVKAMFEFVGQVERDDKGMKIRVQVGGGVLASKKIDAYFTTVEAFASAKVFGYMEAYGDKGSEIFRLLCLGIQQRIAQVSTTVADALFDAKAIQETVKGMDDDDYVESGLGATGSAGLGAGSGSGPNDVESQVSVEGQTGTRLQNKGGKLQGTGVSQVSGELTGQKDPFTLGGKLTGKWVNGQFDALEAEVSGSAMIDVTKLNEIVVGGRWLSGLISSFSGMVSKSGGLLSEEPARKAGSLATFIAANSGLGVAAEMGTQRALAKLKNLNGVKVGHKITVKATWSRKTGFGFEITLERMSTIEFGDNPRATVYVLVESCQQVFKIKKE